jgi:hypothetical protein
LNMPADEQSDLFDAYAVVVGLFGHNIRTDLKLCGEIEDA